MTLRMQKLREAAGILLMDKGVDRVSRSDWAGDGPCSIPGSIMLLSLPSTTCYCPYPKTGRPSYLWPAGLEPSGYVNVEMLAEIAETNPDALKLFSRVGIHLGRVCLPPNP